MKAAVLEELHQPLTLMDVETPALSFGQVLVRVLVSGICGAQLQEISGLKGNAKYLPHLMGHEGCGIVEETGPGVSHVSPGDKVVMHWRKGEGIECGPIKYARANNGTRGTRPSNGEMIGAGPVTTLCEYAVVSENRVTTVPYDVPEELCALLGCGLSTALGTMEQEARLLMGESVLIIGCGGLGLNLILAARLMQAWPIHVTDIHAGKRELALSMGATDFVVGGAASDIRGGFDVVIDTSGNPEAMAWGISMLGDCGRFIMVGQPGPTQSVSLLNARHLFKGEGNWIKATQGGGFQPHADIPRYVNLWRSGAFGLVGTVRCAVRDESSLVAQIAANGGGFEPARHDAPGSSQRNDPTMLAPIISHRLPLDRVNEGIDLVRKGQAGRVMIQMGEPNSRSVNSESVISEVARG